MTVRNSASGVVLPHEVTNEQTYSWASSRDERGNALENNITGILETDYRYSPHLTWEWKQNRFAKHCILFW